MTVSKHAFLAMRSDLYSAAVDVRIKVALEAGHVARSKEIDFLPDLRHILLNDTSDDVRVAAAASLGQFRDPVAMLDLVTALEHAPIRQQAAAALECLGEPNTAFLIYAAQVDDELRLRKELVRFRESHPVSST